MATFEICRDPLLVDVSDIYIRAAYLDMLFMWQDIYGWDGDPASADVEISKIASENGLSCEEIMYIGRRALKDILELHIATEMPAHWGKSQDA